jgi:hypothetical protein
MTPPSLAGSVYPKHVNRRVFIGGSDARVIMGTDEAALVRLGERSGARQSRLII